MAEHIFKSRIHSKKSSFLRWSALVLIFFSPIFRPSLAIGQQAGDTVLSVREDTLSHIERLLELAEYDATRNTSSSVEHAREALQLSRSGQMKAKTGRCYYHLGYAHYNMNHYDSANIYLQKAKRISRQTNDRATLALTYNRIGNTYQLQGEFARALENYQQALKLNQEINNKGEVARSLTNIGSVYRTFGKYDEAIQFHLDALSTYEETSSREGIAWVSLNISRLFKLNEDYDKALEYLNKALNLYRKIAREEGVETGVTLCLKEYSLIYSQSGQPEKALEYSKKVLERNRSAGNRYGIANTYFTMGKIYLNTQNYSQSLHYLQKSLSMKKKLSDQTELSSILRLIGENHMQRQQHARARTHFQKALHQARIHNQKEEIKNIYHALYQTYKQSGSPGEALNYYTAYSRLKDSLNDQRISELEMQYEFERKQEQLRYEQKKKEAIQQARLKRQQILTYAFIIGFLLLLALLVVIYKSYKRKVRSNSLLAQQKQEIENQRDEIEAQRNTATEQRDEIARQNRIITESIEYASRIQSAVLPQEKNIGNIFSDYFILYRPKNIVSGDFYWINQIDSKVVIVAADCTGHGVPGAFMSMLGVAFLNEIINQNRILDPGRILYQLRTNLIDALHQTVKKRGSRDGMDMALAIIDTQTHEIQFSGAYNPMYIIRDNEIIDLKANRMPIGVHAVFQETPFSVQKEQLYPNDKLYFFSDGFTDQFGGDNGHKLGRRKFKEILLGFNDHPMEEQKEALSRTLDHWMNSWNQIDDIMVMGFRFPLKPEEN
jgi:serine phosphatase RsbU (regulator of sigma subunit)/uncharacterized protein HemY